MTLDATTPSQGATPHSEGREPTGLADKITEPTQQRWPIVDARVLWFDAEESPGSLQWIPSQPNSDHLQTPFQHDLDPVDI